MLGRAAPALLLLGVLLGAGCITFEVPGAEGEAFKPYTTVVVANATGVSGAAPGDAEFYHVQVWGHEKASHVRGKELPSKPCSRPWQFSVNRTTHSLTYLETLRPAVNVSRMGAVVTFNVWGVQVFPDHITEGCPSIYDIRGHSIGTYPNVNRTVGRYGSIDVTLYPEGLIAFGGQKFVDLGKKLIVSYGRLEETSDGAYFVQGGFEITNLGAWPKDRLVTASSGMVTKGPG